jgi:hypothetical protein
MAMLRLRVVSCDLVDRFPNTYMNRPQRNLDQDSTPDTISLTFPAIKV